ncbi:DUF2726 domain-containing protein [Methylophaga sp. OBS4]|uniref:DUF2726 domain-containing protein n=1 Tax=Methylophaga sp. OBS4 TaxID=2991935 RepID=UPI002251FD7F|nr:DUF2726 domain-containing protein [Methylophaga sp. OBS4]MCX4186235.1 DUF2726 domain-containing protein [Methylophaga sp. OBS4]
MEFLFIIIFVAAIAVFFIKSFHGTSKDSTEEPQYPYFKNSSLLTPAEISFKHALKIAVADQYEINIKVRLADLISVHKSQSKSEWQKSFNKIQSKHVDFVLTDKDTSEILCAIELDDSSHSRASRQKRDKFLDNAFKSAKLPLIRFPANRAYQSQTIVDNIKEMLEPVTIIDEQKADSDAIKVYLEPQTEFFEAVQETISDKCPKCGSLLVERAATKGKYAGIRFLGCSNFPQCRYRSVSGEST